MAGHVFIVRGDIRRIACDAWLMPADASGRAEEYVLPGQPAPRWPAPPADWDAGTRRVLALDGWPAGGPRPWLVHVGGSPATPIRWYADGVRQFLDRVGPEVRGGPGWLDRAKPLVALPIVGTGSGGGKHRAGDIVKELLPTLYRAAADHDIDLILVAHDGPALAAAQAARQQLKDGRSWRELTADLRHQAEELAGRASDGELALFLGAGVSASAGLPLWGGLLDRLAEQAGMSDSERGELRQLDALDQAGVLAIRLGGRPALQQAICTIFTWPYCSLAHALLAALPVREAVTTNYDQLFEVAWQAVGRDPSVLPHAARPDADRWLLKLHGCISLPEQIVLTREDVLGYDGQRAAMAGLVQGLLLTRHILFVGFSLKDDNFHRIADAVRRAVRAPLARRPLTEPFGTALMTTRKPLVEELWRDDLRWVSMWDPTEDPPPGAEDGARRARAAGRRLEVFLDDLLAQTRDTAHLFDERYQAVLTPGEARLRDALLRLQAELPTDARATPAWGQLQKVLTDLGLGGGE